MDKAYGAIKTDLLSPLRGNILEIGPGTGANLPFYARHAVRLTGIEPNRYMWPYLEKRAVECGMTLQILDGNASQLDLPDGRFDAVVCTLVLCSIEDVGRVLAEVQRVLKPGGRFLFLEHVAADVGTWNRRCQEFVRPVWSYLGDGCHPAKETWRDIEAAGFAELHLEHRAIPSLFRLVNPHIFGCGVR